MSQAVEGGAAIAWRLLATLEGGSLLLAASALLAYTARSRAVRRPRRTPLPCHTVALTDTTNDIGKEVKRRLEAHGCVVSTLTSGADSELPKFDALVVIGAQPKANGLDGLSDLVTEDVYTNIKLLEDLSSRVNRGGYIAWACAPANNSMGAFRETASAFDTVIKASLLHIAKVFHCTPLWIGRCEGAERTAERVVAALMTSDTDHDSRFSIRYAAHTVGEYLYRWLKIIT